MVLKLEGSICENNDQNKSVNLKGTPQAKAVKKMMMNTQKIQFQNFMDDYTKKTMNQTNKLNIETSQAKGGILDDEDDEIAQLARQMNNLDDYTSKKSEYDSL